MHRRRLLYVTAAVCVAAIGDIATTIYGIESGAMVEGNPYVIAQLETGGYPLWLFVKSIGVMAVVALYAFSRNAVPEGYGWTGYTAPVVWIVSHAVVTAHNGMLILSA